MGSHRSRKGFKAGDIICPLPGRSQSQYWSLKSIKKAVVVEVPYAGNSYLFIELLEGRTFHKENYGSRMGADQISDPEDSRRKPFYVDDNAFQLKLQDYEIF